MSTKAQVDTIYDIVKQYYRKHGEYPASLEALTRSDPSNDGDPCLDADNLLDAWGRKVLMRFDDRGKLEIVSLGANGTEDGFIYDRWGYGADVSSNQSQPVYDED